MGENSSIQWTHHTFNPWIGCQKITPGCLHCYMMERDKFVRIQRQQGREVNGPRGVRHVTSDTYWKKPFTWNRKAKAAGDRHRVFCASLADVGSASMNLNQTKIEKHAEIASVFFQALLRRDLPVYAAIQITNSYMSSVVFTQNTQERPPEPWEGQDT